MDRKDVRERLDSMRRAPRMHAQSKEAFMLVTLLLLEVAGVRVTDWLGCTRGNLVLVDGEVTDEWAHTLIDRALERLGPV